MELNKAGLEGKIIADTPGLTGGLKLNLMLRQVGPSHPRSLKKDVKVENPYFFNYLR